MYPQLGSHIENIETPALIIDIERLDHNYSVVSDMYAETECKMRQHAKNIKSPVVLQRQIDRGGTVGGVCVAKVAEAEVMVQSGIRDILVTSEVVDQGKLSRLCSLAKIADIKLCIDNEENLSLISKTATSSGVNLGVLIEVDTSMGRAGVRTPEQGVRLAELAEELPSVEFLGVMSHQTVEGWADREVRFTEGKKFIEQCLDVKRAIEEAGIEVKIVSSGETFTIDVAAEIPGVTEVEGGTYALMSAPTGYMDDFEMAGKILTTVIDVRDDVAFIDAGIQCLGGPFKVAPVIEGMEDIEFIKMESSHSVIKFDPLKVPIQKGTKLHLLSSQQDIMVNRWDSFIAIRDDLVEAVWDIPARGCHH